MRKDMQKTTTSAIALVIVFSAAMLCAQTLAPPVSGKIIGSDGQPVAGAKVVFTFTGNDRKYDVKTGKNGEFIIAGLPYGAYKIEVFSPDGQTMAKTGKQITDDETANQTVIDLSKAGPAASSSSGGAASGAGGGSNSSAPKAGTSMSQQQVEEIKAKNAKIQSENALITQAMNAMNAKQYQQALEPLQQLIAADPNRYEFYQTLGDAQLNLGQFDQAIANYQKGIQTAQASTAVDPKDPSTDPAKKKARIGAMYTNMGNAYLKLKKNNEAVDAFSKAAETSSNPGTAWFNLCVTQFNAGNAEGALTACDKAIAADPTRADAYFIKGSLLIAGSTTDKAGKVTAPAGTAEALNKYLELAPDGPHAADVKQMLQFIGAKVETTYKAPKK
jgi:tetratricopeptide (TPR) repeat protein